MNSYIFEKYNYNNNNQNNFKNININISPQAKMNIPIKTSKREYFPIESDKSKKGGHTIYLVTEDTNFNNEIEKAEIPKKISEDNEEEYEDKDISEENQHTDDYENEIIFPQRSIEFQICKKNFNYSLNGPKLFKNKINANSNKSLINISENKSYEFNKNIKVNNNKNDENKFDNKFDNNFSNNKFDNNNFDNKFDNNFDNKFDNNFDNNFDNHFDNHFDNNFDNNFSSINPYKILNSKILHKGLYKDPSRNEKYNNNKKSHRFHYFSNINAYEKKINVNKNKIINEDENKDILNNKKIYSKVIDRDAQKSRNYLKDKDNNKKEGIISLTEGKKKNIFDKKNSNDNINVKESRSNHDSFSEFSGKKNNNDTILNKSLDNINNINSIYKSLDFFQNSVIEDINNPKIIDNTFVDGIKNIERKKSLKKAMDRYNRFKSLGRLDTKKNKETANVANTNIKIITNDNPNKTNSPIIGAKKDSYDNNNNDNGENEIKDIISENREDKNDENKIMEDENENENEFSFNSELKKFEKKNNLNDIVKDITELKNDINNDIENLNNNIVNNNNMNNNDKIIEKEDNVNNIIIDDENGINKNKKRIKLVKENNIDNFQDEIVNKNDISNNSNNNIINNSINININNSNGSNDNMNSKIKDQNKYLPPINNIKYQNKVPCRPGYFIRKVVREEHYYVDENGKEKILEVKQEYINNEDKKKMNYPYKKKSLNLGAYLNTNNSSLNSTLVKDKENNLNNYINVKTNKKININLNRNNDSFEEKKKNMTEENINIDKNKKEFIDSFSSKFSEKRSEQTIYNRLNEKNNDYLVNDNMSNNSETNKNIFYNQCRTQENNNTQKKFYNRIKENKSIFTLKDKKALNINSNKNLNRNKENPIVINRSKYLEKKEKPIKPRTINNNYFSNNDYSSNSFNNNNLNTISYPYYHEDENNRKKNNLSTINNSIDNYIKVNKVNKYKKLSTEQNLKYYNKLNSNTITITSANNKRHSNISNNTNSNKSIHVNNKRRESSKNHAYHEIKLTSTTNKSKLSSSSLSHYYNHETPSHMDELNTSSHTNKYSLISNISERNNNPHKNSFYQSNNIRLKTIDTTSKNNKERNLSNKNSTSSLFLKYKVTNKLKSNGELNNSTNRDNYKYYESKSTKKEYNNYNDTSTNNTNNNNSNYKRINRNNTEKNDKYFYSNYDFNTYNNNYDYNNYNYNYDYNNYDYNNSDYNYNNYNNYNYQTDKKYKQTSQYYKYN